MGVVGRRWLAAEGPARSCKVWCGWRGEGRQGGGERARSSSRGRARMPARLPAWCPPTAQPPGAFSHRRLPFPSAPGQARVGRAFNPPSSMTGACLPGAHCAYLPKRASLTCRWMPVARCSRSCDMPHPAPHRVAQMQAALVDVCTGHPRAPATHSADLSFQTKKIYSIKLLDFEQARATGRWGVAGRRGAKRRRPTPACLPGGRLTTPRTCTPYRQASSTGACRWALAG